MTSHTQSILRALFEDDVFPTADCRACQNQLSAYVDTALAGNDAAAAFPTTHAHLDGCATCQEARDELRALLALEQSGELAAPPLAASFDFSYLPARPPAAASEPKPAGQPWRLDALGRLVIQFTADLLRAMQGPALQPSYLKSDAPQPLIYALTGTVDDLDVRINAEPARRNPDRYDVEVDVDIPSRGGWPNLAGSVVVLLVQSEEFDRQETDAFGKALFENVPADALPGVAIVVEP
ncbi:MAG: hypothetical protein KDI07_14120 [Anaerolineae bacterium]|nr:hypothetical protein [Anaerolineae bacterium]